LLYAFTSEPLSHFTARQNAIMQSVSAMRWYTYCWHKRRRP